MKDELHAQLRAAFNEVVGSDADGAVLQRIESLSLERSRDPEHGDFVTNAALQLAKPLGKNPRELAQQVVTALVPVPGLIKVEVAGPGFINCFVDDANSLAVIDAVLAAGADFGRVEAGTGPVVQVEFVSANPTGPLHVGHGRGAAYGDALARLLRAAGYRIHTEYYVNDAGRQMSILALSVWLRAQGARGAELEFPAKAYQGSYVGDIAKKLAVPAAEISSAMQEALAQSDAEAVLDAAISVLRTELGEGAFADLRAGACREVLDGIKQDLERFGVSYDTWYSELSLVDDGRVAKAVDALTDAGSTYMEGAVWFAATRFGDDKDRVLVRENGEPTYFASDVAYHLDKFERGFDSAINIWGADHHGYVPRVKAALSALGIDPARLDVGLVQFATLYRGSERLQMSTRSGEFVTLAELCDEVGVDAARFFYVMRRSEQHLDFDLDLAKEQSSDNPVYYIQYAYARVRSVERQLAERDMVWDAEEGARNYSQLTNDHEQALIGSLERFPDLLQRAAAAREPHQVANYLRELANQFHSYYNAHKLILDDRGLSNARISLARAVAQVIANGCNVLGVSTPERM